MNKDDILKKIRFVVYGENAWRVQAMIDKHGEMYILYDSHGQSAKEAQRTIRNIVNLCMIPMRIKIIHGFHNGTAIKNMLQEMNFYGKIACVYTPKKNMGETILRVG